MLGNSKKKRLKGLRLPFLQKYRQQRNAQRNPEVGAGDAEEHGSVVLTIYHPPQKKEVAQVILNGYNIEEDTTFGTLGAMRSFKIVRGDLWEEWNSQTAVALMGDSGQEMMVKIAALPVDEESFGLIEFVSSPL